jgi:hypothetical protein
VLTCPVDSCSSRSSSLTEDQVKWVNTQRLLLRLKPDKVVTYEPGPELPWRQWCFRIVHDEEKIGRPTNAPLHARFYGKVFDRTVRITLILNVVAFALWSDPIGRLPFTIYELLNYLFTIAFAVEAAIKIVAFTLKEYMRVPLNVFEFMLAVVTCMGAVVTLFAQYVVGIDVQGEPAMRWLRCFRALRILRLAVVSPSLKRMMQTMIFASPSIANITVGIFLFTSAYAQFGMAFLGTLVYDNDGAGFSRHANFETAFRAFSTLVRMSTGDSWSALLADAVHNPHVPGIAPPLPATVYFFFVFYMAFMQWVLISIFVAIILEYFNESNAEKGVDIKFEDVESFQLKWLEFDVGSTSYVKTVDLGLLLYSCKPPLVGVRETPEDGGFFTENAARYVRPTVKQLELLLVELDVPEHDGYVHFLEVLLALLQRLTGVINEEQIMSKLLQLHPTYVRSIKQMPGITGSTADPFVKDEIMMHLRRGLAATGLSEDDEVASFNNSSTTKSNSLSRSFTRVRSFTRARSFAKDDDLKQQEQKEKAQNRLRASLSMVATSNAFQRTLIEKVNREEQSMRRTSVVGAASTVASSILGGKQSFKKSKSPTKVASQEEDPLAC